MTWQTITGSIRALLAVAGLIGLFVAPMGITTINSTVIQYVVWATWGLLVIFCAGVIGLTPYFGMREMKRDAEAALLDAEEGHKTKIQELTEQHQKTATSNSTDIFNARKEIEDLKQQNQRLQQARQSNET